MVVITMAQLSAHSTPDGITDKMVTNVYILGAYIEPWFYVGSQLIHPSSKVKYPNYIFDI